MSTAGLVLTGILVLVSLAVLALPLVRHQGTVVDGVQRSKETLAAEYERVLSIIRELDDDYNVGKVTPEVYQRERAQWTEQGVQLLQALEQSAPAVKARVNRTVKAQPAAETPEQVLDQAVEQAIAAYVKATK